MNKEYNIKCKILADFLNKKLKQYRVPYQICMSRYQIKEFTIDVYDTNYISIFKKSHTNLLKLKLLHKILKEIE
jgi:hypothetical protein